MEKTKQILSKRLQMAASLVTRGYRVADVGTDHGFVPIYLVKMGICPSALAMDVRVGPLERAKEHIEAYGLEEKIQTRLSDGLEKLQKGEADSVVIAGMGGPLMVRILQDGQAVLEEVEELILSPHTEVERVRRWLQEAGWYIKEEHMLQEDGKYYVFLKAVHGVGDYESQNDFCFGKRLTETREAVWEQSMTVKLEKLRKVERQLAAQDTAGARARLEEVQEQIRQMETTLYSL